MGGSASGAASVYRAADRTSEKSEKSGWKVAFHAVDHRTKEICEFVYLMGPTTSTNQEAITFAYAAATRLGYQPLVKGPIQVEAASVVEDSWGINELWPT